MSDDYFIPFLDWEKRADFKSGFPLIWKRNLRALNQKDQEKLFKSKVLVLGCGGLGCVVVEMLARIGVGKLVIIDGDVFEESNLNRQLFCTLDNLGQKKAVVAQNRVKEIAPFCQVEAVVEFVSPEDIAKYLTGVDVVIDCLGGVQAKASMLVAVQKFNYPLIVGAMAGWEGLVCSVWEQSRLPLEFFQGNQGAEETLGSPVTTVCLIASLQVQEAICFLTKGKFSLLNKVLYVSLLNLSFDRFDL